MYIIELFIKLKEKMDKGEFSFGGGLFSAMARLKDRAAGIAMGVSGNIVKGGKGGKGGSADGAGDGAPGGANAYRSGGAGSADGAQDTDFVGGGDVYAAGDEEKCEHIFSPVDSTKTVLACVKCGFLIHCDPDEFKKKNIFEE